MSFIVIVFIFLLLRWADSLSERSDTEEQCQSPLPKLPPRGCWLRQAGMSQQHWRPLATHPCHYWWVCVFSVFARDMHVSLCYQLFFVDWLLSLAHHGSPTFLLNMTTHRKRSNVTLPLVLLTCFLSFDTRENAFWATWRFLLQYHKWPLGEFG